MPIFLDVSSVQKRTFSDRRDGQKKIGGFIEKFVAFEAAMTMIQKRSFSEHSLTRVLWSWRRASPEAGKVWRHAMKVGYARVSKKDQNLDLQLRALKAEGCKRIFREKMSGKRWDRPELHAALRSLRKGDILIVWHLDRLGRTARELLNLNYEFKCQGIAIKSLTQNLETETPDGEYNFTMSCAEAQRERERISLRTRDGLEAARARGAKLGRPRRLSMKQIERARLAQTAGLSVEALAGRFKVGKATMQRALAGAA